MKAPTIIIQGFFDGMTLCSILFHLPWTGNVSGDKILIFGHIYLSLKSV